MSGLPAMTAPVAPGRRERKKEQTREALVASAFRLVAERGFDHVTVEQIADDCDISPRTFFRYFASKEDVLFADGDADRQRMVDAVAAQPPGLGAFAAMEGAVRSIVEEFDIDREAMLRRRDIVAANPSLRARAIERYHGWESSLIDELRAPGRDGTQDELAVRLAVAATISALRVAVGLWIEDPSTGSLEDLLAAALTRLRTGLDS